MTPRMPARALDLCDARRMHGNLVSIRKSRGSYLLRLKPVLKAFHVVYRCDKV